MNALQNNEATFPQTISQSDDSVGLPRFPWERHGQRRKPRRLLATRGASHLPPVIAVVLTLSIHVPAHMRVPRAGRLVRRKGGRRSANRSVDPDC
jgi:hypothetical protein